MKDSDTSPNLTSSASCTPLMSSHLMGVIAHDIRSPITVIRGYLKMILTERVGPLTVDQKECLEGAMNSMDQLNSLAGMIGGAAGIMEQIHAEALNLQVDLWRTSWHEVQSQAQAKDIVIREQFPAEPLMVCGDRRILCEVIQKVIVRSVALANRNSELIAELSTRKTGEVVLRILFSGSSVELPGQEVASELLPLVFLHGGKLTFSSRNETGSSFTLMLPRKDP